MGVTIQDLASEFGVDKATASRALRGKPGVSDDLRARIVERARALGFHPNAQARSLATGRTETIGLVFCDETSYFLQNPFYSAVLAGIVSEANARGYALSFCSVSWRDYEAGELPKVMRERRADAFLFVGDQQQSLIGETRRAGFPLVLVDHRVHGENFRCVVIDNIDGACQAVEHLVSLGHRRIGYVSGALKSPSFSERLSGYRAAIRAHRADGDADLVQVGAEGEAGYECMKRLLALPRPPTAVFACNDVNAVQAMKALHEAGLRVPRDASVVGFDDSRIATDLWPALTTMRVDKHEMGRLAVRELLKALEGEPDGEREIAVKTTLVVRESTARPA